MNPSNPIRNPENLARVFSMYVRALVQFTIWAIIGLAAVAGAYVGLRAILVAVTTVLKALGL